MEEEARKEGQEMTKKILNEVDKYEGQVIIDFLNFCIDIEVNPLQDMDNLEEYISHFTTQEEVKQWIMEHGKKN